MPKTQQSPGTAGACRVLPALSWERMLGVCVCVCKHTREYVSVHVHTCVWRGGEEITEMEEREGDGERLRDVRSFW